MGELKERNVRALSVENLCDKQSHEENRKGCFISTTILQISEKKIRLDVFIMSCLCCLLFVSYMRLTVDARTAETCRDGSVYADKKDTGSSGLTFLPPSVCRLGMLLHLRPILWFNLQQSAPCQLRNSNPVGFIFFAKLSNFSADKGFWW